jgi:hypothetical protein
MLLAHPRPAEVYPRYLAAGYHVTCAMLELMELALACARELDDEVSPGLARYLDRHLVEETHHEEPGGAVLDDLRALGEDAERLVEAAESPKLATLLANERRRIEDDHPVAVLGFLELEACHTPRPEVERLISATGLPRDGFRQLLLHSRLDAVHAAELHDVLDSLPLEPSHERLVGLSALTTVAGVAAALLDVVSEPSSRVASSLEPGTVLVRDRPASAERRARTWDRHSPGATLPHRGDGG